MAKRTIQECDLTKQEYDPDETVIITIKKKGKSKGRSYDLSPDAAAKLEMQLVAGSDAELDSNWTFSPASQEETYTYTEFGEKPVEKTRAELENITYDDIDDDSRFVAAKKAELKEEGIINTEPREVVNSVFKGNGNCSHPNRGRVQMTMRGEERYAYTICKDCRAQLPYKKKSDQENYASAKLPADVRMKDI